MPDRPHPMTLWEQAGGGTPDYSREFYLRLMRDHGHILSPGDQGYEGAPRNLPCGWPGKHAEIADEDVMFPDDPAPAGALDNWDW